MDRVLRMDGRLRAMARFLRAELDGRRAIADVRSLTAWNRTPGSGGYGAAAEYAADALREAGLQGVCVHCFPMDGQSAYRGWAADPAWDVARAEISMSSPVERKLVDWVDDPIAVHQGSWATPEEGIQAELMDVGEGLSEADYADRAIRGSIVLSSGPGQRVYEEAVVKRGAAGILSHHMPWECPEVGRTPAQLPDLVSQGKVRVSLGDKARGFAFSISFRRATELRSLLNEGSVNLRCRIDGGPFAGNLGIVTGRIPGTEHPEKEFVVVAHLCHPSPGANDNASGVALGIELARCLASRSCRDSLGDPRHSIRFLFVPEIIGPLAFLSSDVVSAENLIGGVNIDMVGASQSITRSPLLLENTPWSLPTYAFDLASLLLSLGRPSGRDGQWAYRTVPFEGGSDNIVFNDAPVGAPMVGLGYRADPCYHSNLDIWTNMDADVLANVGLAAGGLAWAAAWMDDRLAEEILRIVSDAQQIGRIGVPCSVQREMIESVRRRTPRDPGIDTVVERHLSVLGRGTGTAQHGKEDDMACLAKHGLASDAYPRRVVESLVWPPINGIGEFLAKLPMEHGLTRKMTDYDYIETYKRIYEILNLSNGQRTWLDVHRLVTGQFAGTSSADVSSLAGLLIDAGALEEIGGNRH